MRRGLVVRPLPQNMSNNAAVAADGGEIGRAYTAGARLRYCSDRRYESVLLKPHGDTGSQIIVQGQVYGTAKAADYYRLKDKLSAACSGKFCRLRADADLVFAEGAGSTAEAHLCASDIANMGFANAAAVPVMLIADIGSCGALPPWWEVGHC